MSFYVIIIKNMFLFVTFIVFIFIDVISLLYFSVFYSSSGFLISCYLVLQQTFNKSQLLLACSFRSQSKVIFYLSCKLKWKIILFLGPAKAVWFILCGNADRSHPWFCFSMLSLQKTRGCILTVSLSGCLVPVLGVWLVIWRHLVMFAYSA